MLTQTCSKCVKSIISSNLHKNSVYYYYHSHFTVLTSIRNLPSRGSPVSKELGVMCLVTLLGADFPGPGCFPSPHHFHPQCSGTWLLCLEETLRTQNRVQRKAARAQRAPRAPTALPTSSRRTNYCIAASPQEDQEKDVTTVRPVPAQE